MNRYALLRLLLANLLVVGLYTMVGAVCHAFFAIPPSNVSALWLGAGVNMAAVMLVGAGVLPGVWVGAFVGSALALAASHDHPMLLAGCMATGSAVQAWVGAWLLDRFVGRTSLLDNARDVARFAVMGGPLPCLIASTVGATTLMVGGIIPPSAWLGSWMIWWVGDGLGVFLMVALVQIWTNRGQERWARRLAVALIPAGLCAVGTVLTFNWARTVAWSVLEGDFHRRGTAVTAALASEFDTAVGLAVTLASYMENTPGVTRESYRSFVTPLVARHSTVQALAWIPRVTPGTRDAMVTEATRDGVEGLEFYSLDPDGKRVPCSDSEDFFAIYYTEPLERNRPALGFRAASRPLTQQAMDRAVETGRPTTSGRFRLVQEPAADWGMVIYAPVHQPGRGGASGETDGFVAVVLRGREVLTEAMRRQPDHEWLRVAWLDENAPPGERLVAQVGELDEAAIEEAFAPGSRAIRFHDAREVGGRRWRMVAMPGAGFLMRYDLWPVWSILTGGLFFTELLGAFLLLVSGRERRIEKMVHERTAQLESANLKLAREVENRTRAQQESLAAKAAADEANAAKSRFLANMSHEIRTPLNAIVCMTEVMGSSPLDPDQKEHLHIIAQSSRGLMDIINDVLDFSKIEAGEMRIVRRPFNLRSVLEEIRAMFRVAADQAGLQLVFDLAPDLPAAVNGDSVRVRQVLINLVGNALKFTPAGSVTVRIHPVGTTSDGVVIRFAVTDTGIGIPPAKQDRLFRPFYQVDDSDTRPHGGTGLGLAICAQLVERMGGQLTAESEVGRGSTFAFAIPMQPAEQPLDDIPPSPSSAGATGFADRQIRLLLVEDNAVNQTVARLLLAKVGVKDCDLAVNGREAVRMVGEKRYDLVLMDCQMPEMDGFQATRAIRAMPGGATLPIVALTANAMDEDRERCLTAGMNDYISKPIDLKALTAILARWLEESPQADAPE